METKIFALFLLLWSAAVSAVIPASRMIAWDPGVRGGIPNRTTIYTTIAAGASTATIQSALNSCPSGQVVQLGPGTFTLTTTLTVKSNTTLRGAGMLSTVLAGSAGFSGLYLVVFNNNFDTEWTQTPYNLVNPMRGDATITTSSAHNFNVGDMVLIDMLQQPAGDPPISNTGNSTPATWLGRDSGTRCVGQLVQITGKPSSTTATITPALYYSYNNTPQAIRATGLTQNAGIESLSINNLASGSGTTGRDTVGVFGAVNCWCYDVKLIGSWRRAVWSYASLWFEWRRCWLQGGVPIGTDGSAQYTSDRGYGIFLGAWNSGMLVVDNIFEELTNSVAFEGCVSGNVIAYNFFIDQWWKTESDYPRRFAILGHGANPIFNLIEGNWSAVRFRVDYNWGTGTWHTVFRNRFQQTDRGSPAAQMWTIDLERGQWYHNFWGNVIGGGTGGVVETFYAYNGQTRPYEDSKSTTYSLGYFSVGSDGSSGFDSGVEAGMIRWGQWLKYKSGGGSGLEYDTANVVDPLDTSQPDSLFLSSKPTWFYGLQFPPYDALAADPESQGPQRIPAGYRYYHGGNNPPSFSLRSARFPTRAIPITVP